MLNEARFAVVYGLSLLAMAIIATALGFKELQFDSTSFAQIGTLLLTLALVAIVIERAVEVYVAKRYDPEKQRIRRPLTRAEARLAKAEDALTEERERRHGSSRAVTADDEKYMQELLKNVDDAREAVDGADEQTWLPLSKVRAGKIRAASFLSLTFGALASFSGVRVLGQFVQMEGGELTAALAESVLQLHAFRVTDAVLTALVLAGGADGIHKMISSFKSFRSSV
ncbi:MAG: hypothetical protein F4145_15760 [Boseongicola sp. SB0675_bin_26]|nr:hypothetical protein [Boseongicola sp. SB0675_bin_26]